MCAGLNTTVLPATSAPLDGPAASAIGKLNGLITAHTPNGRRTSKYSPGEPIDCIGVLNPLCCSISFAFQRSRSADSSTSPSASRRFLPTSIAMSAESSLRCSLIRSAARRMIATRSCHGVFAHVGKKSLAARTASRTSSRVPWANSPMTTPSIGDVAALNPEPSRPSPFTYSWCFCPNHDRAFSIPSS
jgi:hypothetical protein